MYNHYILSFKEYLNKEYKLIISYENNILLNRAKKRNKRILKHIKQSIFLKNMISILKILEKHLYVLTDDFKYFLIIEFIIMMHYYESSYINFYLNEQKKCYVEFLSYKFIYNKKLYDIYQEYIDLAIKNKSVNDFNNIKKSLSYVYN